MQLALESELLGLRHKVLLHHLILFGGTRQNAGRKLQLLFVLLGLASGPALGSWRIRFGVGGLAVVDCRAGTGGAAQDVG